MSVLTFMNKNLCRFEEEIAREDGKIGENSQIPNMHFYYVDNGNLNAIPPPFLEPLHIVHSGQ